MEVEDLAPFHVDTSSEDELVRILISEEWVPMYQAIRDRLLETTGILELDVDIIERLADRLFGFLTVDFGPVTISVALVSFALYQFLNRVKVSGYEVVRTPALVGKAVVGKTKIGRDGYTIEPAPLD